MASEYGSTPSKLKGIEQQPYVLRKVLEFLRKVGYIVHAEPANSYEDKNLKIDYILIFDPSTPFNGKLKVGIDVKYAQSYTIISDNGLNVLEQSGADYVILNNPKRNNELLWVNILKLKECVRLHPPKLINSYEKGNNSKFIWIGSYLNEHKEFFGKTSKIVYL